VVLGRRAVSVHDAASWVFNRIAEVYGARPAYPPALIDALAEFAGPRESAVLDVGAGIGHLALPLSARGFEVTAVEPALRMLEELRAAAQRHGLAVRAVHAAAEALPLAAGSVDLAIIADAMHFIDAELAGIELARVLVPRGRLAVVTCELAGTPFMRGVADAIESATPRRPRDRSQAIVQLFAVTRARRERVLRFQDETPVDLSTLERILRSISFVGPAMNAARFAAFRERIEALPGPRVWARTFTLHTGRRR
jgi:ubiquinone/menaquinone biosynthesis C-methylase UbiE